jgi:hypothetical protein
MDVMHDHNLERFIDFSAEDLEIIREAIHSEAEARDTADADDRLIEAEEEDSEEDKITYDEPVEPRLLPLEAEFCFVDQHIQILEACLSLIETSEWRMAPSYRDQAQLTLQTSHFSQISALFRELGMLFGRNKGSICCEILGNCLIT